jgi:hypothetical protein
MSRILLCIALVNLFLPGVLSDTALAKNHEMTSQHQIDVRMEEGAPDAMTTALSLEEEKAEQKWEQKLLEMQSDSDLRMRTAQARMLRAHISRED